MSVVIVKTFATNNTTTPTANHGWMLIVWIMTVVLALTSGSAEALGFTPVSTTTLRCRTGFVRNSPLSTTATKTTPSTKCIADRHGFVAVPYSGSTHSRTILKMGWFDFTPISGSGSAKDELDEQWEVQQAILAARRSHGLTKEALKKKYKHSAVGDATSSPYAAIEHEDDVMHKNKAVGNASHVKIIELESSSLKEHDAHGHDHGHDKPFKFFWEK